MTTSSPWATATLLLATLSTAMVAGLFFCFAHSVLPGLRALDAPAQLAAFQRVDAAVANPWMGATFLASPALIAASVLLHLLGRDRAVVWLVLALVLALAGVIITVGVHLPINTAIQDAAPSFVHADALSALLDGRWARWNVVRAVTSTGSLAALSWALVVTGRPVS